MKYYEIYETGYPHYNSYGDIVGYTRERLLCVVESEEVAKDFCQRNSNYCYNEIDTDAYAEEYNK